MRADGKMYIDDVGPGDLWYFPAGYPHSIQGIGAQGTEFLLVFSGGCLLGRHTFNAKDVAFVPLMATHYIENTGTEDLILLRILSAPHFVDVSSNAWIGALPDNLAVAHTKLPPAVIRSGPQTALTILPK